MINSRALEIINILYRENDYISIDILAKKIGVKSRTLRNIMKDNHSDFENLPGAFLLYKNNYGYKLQVTDENVFKQAMKEVARKVDEEQYSTPVTTESRCDWIIRNLLMDRTPVKSDDLAERLYVSRSTLTTDLKLVRERLRPYHLDLESKVGGGLYLEGNEMDFRACTADYFFYNDFSSSSAFKSQPIGDFDLQYRDAVAYIVNETLHKNQYHMTDVGIKNLIVHILIALFRIKHNFIQNDEISVLQRANYPTEFSMSEDIRDQIFQKTGIYIPDNSLGYMVIHMMGSRIFTSGEENLITADTLNLVDEILRGILEEFQIDLFDDIDFFTLLCTHIEPMMTRLKNHVKMRNPLLRQVQKEQPLGYEMAVYTAQLIENKYGQNIDENEIGYLALHFQLAFDKRKQNVKKKILTVCASGAGISRMLLYRLQSKFGQKIDKIEAIGLNEISQYNLDQFDLIVTTVPLHVQTKTQILQVEYYLSEDDLSEINWHLTYDGTAKNDILQAFTSNLFFSQLEFDNQRDVIHFLCKQLRENTIVPMTFEQKVYRREELSSTYMGNGIAMPHPEVLMLSETKIVVAHVKEPIMWGKNQVNWIFLLGFQKQKDDMSEPIIKILYSLVKNNGFVKVINEHPNYKTFINTMNELVDKSAHKEEESFFR